jgi:alpha-mannosidase
MNVPLTVASCGFHPGDLPSASAFLTVHDRNVRLAAMKQSEAGEGIVLRMVEVEGRETTARVTVSPALLPQGTAAVEVDTLERPVAGNGARLEGEMLTVQVPAFGIAAVRIE